jgi:hypothetical protein
MKSKTSVKVNSVIGSLPTYAIIEQNNSNDDVSDELLGGTMLKEYIKIQSDTETTIRLTSGAL